MDPKVSVLPAIQNSAPSRLRLGLLPIVWFLRFPHYFIRDCPGMSRDCPGIFHDTFNLDLSSGRELSGNFYFPWQFTSCLFTLSRPIAQGCFSRSRCFGLKTVSRRTLGRVSVSSRTNWTPRLTQSRIGRHRAHPPYRYRSYRYGLILRLMTMYTSFVYIGLQRKPCYSRQIKPWWSHHLMLHVTDVCA